MDCASSFEREGAEDDGPMSERILMEIHGRLAGRQ
jgi:hypothetical protein